MSTGQSLAAARGGIRPFASGPSPRAAHPGGRRACLTCGTEFTRTCNPQRYCTPWCRESWSSEYERQRADQRRGGPPGPRGSRKDAAKRATATALRDEGLTLAAIGERMGISRQRVHQLLTTRDAAAGV